ncbi:hypothetical protein ACFX58_19615 [Sphingomonas sp. NCPPB 2930]
MRIFKKCLGILSIFIIVGATIACSNEDQVRKRLLLKTPIGSSFDHVLNFCIHKNIKCKHSYNSGYLNQKTNSTVGVMSIWGIVEEYKNTPFTVKSTSAYWGFDASGRLIDIWVWQTTDAP